MHLPAMAYKDKTTKHESMVPPLQPILTGAATGLQARTAHESRVPLLANQFSE